ncbi:MAG: glutathione synthase [Pseudomonadota bacterium]
MTSQTLHIGIVMDPIEGISPAKDSTFAMMLDAQHRGYRISMLQQGDLYLEKGQPMGHAHAVTVTDNTTDWFVKGEVQSIELGALDAILMRKDPPFDMEFIYTTYLLDLAADHGALVVNRPQALRDLNEKMATAYFPELTPPTLVTRNQTQLREFLTTHGHIVVKPLDGMGGRSIFTLKDGDTNANVVFETLTDYQTQFAMAQVYVPEITEGDKRILIVDGDPVPYMLARVPDAADGRGNLVMGATADARPLGTVEKAIADRVGPWLRTHGVLFAGLDIIGDKLTEINVTSPTGIREIDKAYDLNIAGQLNDAIERHLAHGVSSA